MAHDSWGRPLREESHLDSGEVLIDDWVCPGEFHCERPGDGFTLRRLEPGPFGRRVRVASHDVLLYDSIGRLVARQSYADAGRLMSRELFRYGAKSKVHRHQSFGDSPYDAEESTTDFDLRGSPLFITGASVTRQVTLDNEGLPVRIEVAKSTLPDVPVGSADDYAYQGAGCAEVLAAQVTNGLVDR